MGKLLTNRNFYSVLLAVVISFAFVAILVNGASTISTNISTGGTLSVTGVSDFTAAVNASSTVIATGRMQTFGQLVLQSATSDPSGPIAGALYYDSTNRVVKLYNGTAWFTVASSTDASGGLIVSGAGIRTNTIATGYMALGTSTLPIATSTLSLSPLLHLDATTTATVPLQITGVIGQTGDVIRAFQTTAAAGHVEVFAVDAVGGASTTVLSTTRRAADALVISGYATTSGSTGNMSTEGTLTVTGAQTFTGAMSANGNVTLGDAVTDTLTITAAATTTQGFNINGSFLNIRGLATTTTKLSDEVATTTIGAVAGSVLGIGTTTPAGQVQSALGVVGNVYVASPGTTTLHLKSTTAARGSCIEFTGNDGKIFRFYIASGVATSSLGSCYGGTN